MNKLNSLVNENEELKQNCIKKQEHITHLENKIHRMRNQIKKLEVLYHYRRQEGTVDLKTECYNFKKENEQLRKRTEQLSIMLNYLYEENERLKKRNQTLKERDE